MSTVSLMPWDHTLVIIICLREFSKSLTDRAYTWYTTLAQGFIYSWEDLSSRLCKKYFQHEERVTTTQLNNTRQKHGEDPVDFVRGSGIWLWTAMIRMMKKCLLKFILATLWQITESI
ncbi:hypothetical protein L3X38_004737 [Prunus dulcis]|uniref:Retrotransposon gag domain-containing protein n=1 Tax=Prunus dulcis TaxID=3755 RepID=A0AAD4ZPN8_PRUDU|nr:hypothetical protein L3X38_004737 [Prunus dulcis]